MHSQKNEEKIRSYVNENPIMILTGTRSASPSGHQETSWAAAWASAPSAPKASTPSAPTESTTATSRWTTCRVTISCNCSRGIKFAINTCFKFVRPLKIACCTLENLGSEQFLNFSQEKDAVLSLAIVGVSVTKTDKHIPPSAS